MKNILLVRAAEKEICARLFIMRRGEESKKRTIVINCAHLFISIRWKRLRKRGVKRASVSFNNAQTTKASSYTAALSLSAKTQVKN